jgi:chemosensory pili system protein ChpA (sensor histidine kinase/response regulator)
MQLVDKLNTPDQDLVVKDLGPLSWVIDELRKSFDNSIKGYKRFLQETGSAQSDLSAIDTNLLRSAKYAFHQILGVLKLLEIDENATMVDAMEMAAAKFVQRPALVTDDAVRKLEHASFAVLEYLESLLAGKKVSSIGLFAQYRDVKLLAGFDRVHPADLWGRQPFQWLQADMPYTRGLDYGAEVRADIDSALLRWMQSADAQAATELSQLSLGLSQSQNNLKAATFWKISAAFFEALAQNLIPVDIYAKRSASGIIAHYNNLKHGDWVFSDKFMQNMLFLCGQADIQKSKNAPSLKVVQKVWGLEQSHAESYELNQFGRFDPAVLALSKRRIIVAKELWTALSGGDIQKIRGTSEQFKLVSESLIKLYPSSQPLALALTNASDSVLASKEPPNAEFAMEVATAILYLEAVFEGWGSTDLEMEMRANKLAQRIERVRNGAQAETVEPWIEELYRRVSDRESMGSVVGELRICLTDIEKSIDQYFRSPSVAQALQFVPGKLSQMRGIFSILGLEEAVSAVIHMRDRVEEFESPKFNFERARVTGVFDKFGNNLGALGFLIDMLNYQPTLVKKLFAFDIKTLTLNPLMGRVNQTIESYAPPPSLAQTVSTSTASTSTSTLFASATTTVGIAAPQAVEQHAIKAADAVSQAKKLASEEHELREVFLDEADEVIASGLAACQTLLIAPENLEQQSTLRRAFHTLKGSSRMVRLDDFGEAGWFLEQVINTRLADQTPFDADICHLAIAALRSFSAWADDLRLGDATKWRSQTFKLCADAMRFDDRLDTTGLVQSAIVEKNIVAVPDLTNAKLESDDQALLRALESFELLELPSLPSEQAQTDNPRDVNKEVIASPNIHSQEKEKEKEQELVITPPHVVEPVAFAEVVRKSETLTVVAAIPVPVPVIVTTNVVNISKPPTPVEDVDEFKIIGELKIGIPLYNVYLNEADEWSRCLVTELDEWAIEYHKPLRASTVSFAHSLAGSSATVGFHQLSGLAKQLEQALDKVYLKASGAENEAVIFAQTAEECRRLLHQFAAGFLEEPKATVVSQLNGLKFIEEPTVAPQQVAPIVVIAPSVPLPPLVPVPQAVIPQAAIPQAVVPLAAVLQLQQVALPALPIANHDSPNFPPPTAHRVIPAIEYDDDIELVDSLDPDLFHIFEEEAQELLPKLGSSLRQWVAHPEDMRARSEILRTLHTLKGSSRLAGAMRLGELSHRMESEIEFIGSENLSTQAIEPLLTRLDSLQNIFEVIAKSSNLPADIPSSLATKFELNQSQIDTTTQEVVKDVPALVPESREVADSRVSQLASPVKFAVKPPAASILKLDKGESRQSVRVRARLLDRLVNQAGEVMLTRTRIESELGQLRGSLGDLTGNLDRLRQQLRDVEFQAETQMQSRMEQAKDSQKSFDPLEFDRFTRVQELTRMMAESVNDVATVQRNLQRTVDSTEDDLVSQARQTRDLQRDLLRTRMEEFESISERLYRVVRQASKDAVKQVKLDIVGGSIEMDRGVLERMTPSFEHLLRNCIAHGLEHSDKRLASGKEATGAISINLLQDGNDVVIEFGDDGAGLNYERIREQAISQKLISKNDKLTDAETVNLIFAPGLSTATQVTELSGRGIGLDIVRAEVIALGGRIDVSSEAGKGTKFKLILPLTTAVTQVVMMRTGALSFGVPSHLVELVRRSTFSHVEQAYATGFWGNAEENIPFYWSGALLQASQRSSEPLAKTNPIVIFRSAGQRVAIHVDEIFGNKEVVIKNLGPQLARLPGLAGMAILVSGAVALIYNPVALASVYGSTLQQYSPVNEKQVAPSSGHVTAAVPSAAEQQTPLILVVDDSITVRRVTQRMLQREGFRVVLAVDGLQAIEKLNLEIPAVVLSDIEMPRMDGFDLLRNIRADAKLKHLPVVMITSRIAEKHRELAMDLGVNDYLGKPYSEEGLLAVLRQHTAKKQEDSASV